MKRFILAGLLVLAAGMAANAQTQGGISIDHAWSRATASANATGVVYLTITDTGAPDKLTGASTPVAAKAQLHESTMQNGVMHMRPVDTLPVSQDQPIRLAPGGYHLMLTGMKQPLKTGDTFPLTLNFEHAGAVATVVTVEAAGSSGADAMRGMDMKDMGMKGMDMGH